jgi:hypothetical protein
VALQYLSGRWPGSEVGVFGIDRGLTVLQGFTEEAAELEDAIEAMTSLAPTTLAGPRERQLTSNAYHGLGEGLGQAHVAAAESRGAPECRGREEVRIRLNELLESRLIEGFESLGRDQRASPRPRSPVADRRSLHPAGTEGRAPLLRRSLAIPRTSRRRSTRSSPPRTARVSVITSGLGAARRAPPTAPAYPRHHEARSRYDTDEAA